LSWLLLTTLTSLPALSTLSAGFWRLRKHEKREQKHSECKAAQDTPVAELSKRKQPIPRLS
jgi:cytochrome oxidase assembly protein ShyY1